MKQTIRSFSLGLLTAGAILLIVYYFVEVPKEQSIEMPLNDMVTELEEAGYRIITEDEYITLSIEKDKQQDKQSKTSKDKTDNKKEKTTDKTNKEKKNKKQTKEKKEEKPKTYTLKIESGMPSSDIGQALEENDIIDDASEFNQYIEEKDYSLRVQLGEFKVQSDMSFYEIAEAITK